MGVPHIDAEKLSDMYWGIGGGRLSTRGKSIEAATETPRLCRHCLLRCLNNPPPVRKKQDAGDNENDTGANQLLHRSSLVIPD